MMEESGGRHFFSADETDLSDKVLATHAPDMAKLDVKPILSIIDDIISRAKPLSADENTNLMQKAQDPSQSNSSEDDVTKIAKVLEYPINHTSYMITWKCVGEVDSHSVTMELLESLSKYSWDAKVVITYAAIAINYGEFWLLHQLEGPKNPLANSIATLMGVSDLSAHSDVNRLLAEVLNLLTEGLKLTHCIIFKEIPPVDNVCSEFPISYVPKAVYWIIRSGVACASTLTDLFGAAKSTEVGWEITSLTRKLTVILNQLQDHMKKISEELDKRKNEEDAYNKKLMELRSFLESAHPADNIKVLRAFLRLTDRKLLLYDGLERRGTSLEVLRLKYVLLLISHLDFPREVLHVLRSIHSQPSTRHDYEILWLPILDPTTSMTSSQTTLFHREKMPWFSVRDASMVDPVAIRFIREDLKFMDMPMLFVLDPHGKLSTRDALPMMWIWGANAFPFTPEWERKLWRKSEWNIDLLVDNIDPRIQEWIKSNKVICLYGGDDVDWIRKFTQSARASARALNIALKMLYVGNGNPNEKVQQCIEVITRENLSHIFPIEYADYIWYFWSRVYFLRNSMKQSGCTLHVMQGILDLDSYDSSKQCWAVFSHANGEMTKGKGDIVLPVLDKYREWAYEVDHPDKFVDVLDKQLRGHHTKHRCDPVTLAVNADYIPDIVYCSHCGKMLDKYIMYCA